MGSQAPIPRVAAVRLECRDVSLDLDVDSCDSIFGGRKLTFSSVLFFRVGSAGQGFEGVCKIEGDIRGDVS